MGANLAIALAARHQDWQIIAFDNLKRRGSELNLPRLRDAGVAFVHGDVREPADLAVVGRVDALVECSAEPSALAGVNGSPEYVVQSNLLGAFNCLELARRDDAYLVFLSTSRFYPVTHLSSIRLDENTSRFEIAQRQDLPGISPAGVSEAFPLDGARTIYGTTKLSAELLIDEYAEGYGLRATIDRCGVISGPWQMGKADQGVYAFWMLAHHFGRPLSYIGFGGTGKQVRDLLHVDDLVDLVDEQLAHPEHWSGCTFNVGGGRDCSLSLLEATTICRELTGNEVHIRSEDATRPGDIPIYVSDCSLLFEHTAWRPRRGARQILEDIRNWSADHDEIIRSAIAPDR